MGTAVIHFTAAAISDRGRKRPSNEDAFGYSVENGVYVVCDGMGGAAAGEIASSLAVDEVMKLLTNRDGAISLPNDAEQAVAAANQAIFARAERSNKLSGMGTTMVALLAQDRRVWMVNVGDSRGYQMRNGHLQQITVDHSLVEEQVRLGRLDPAEALRSPLRNVITRALGTQSSVTPDIFEIEIEPGDLFLLCSDGLTRELSDASIESLLRVGAPLEELCSGLVSAANQAGGHDNITCLLVRVDA
ncbi:MAG: Stp1/IreP family PP2C-type Ser/Thr phosphatase [Terracidiphilus sp.]